MSPPDAPERGLEFILADADARRADERRLAEIDRQIVRLRLERDAILRREDERLGVFRREMAESAEALARRLHADQRDQRGEPYVDHLAAVAAILRRRWPDAPAWAVDAAWLHDAVEDGHADATNLHTAGIDLRAIFRVGMLTRPDGVTYRNWIANLASSGDLWAIRIKLADLEHNSDPARRLPGSDIVERRYEPARRMLELVESRLSPAADRADPADA